MTSPVGRALIAITQWEDVLNDAPKMTLTYIFEQPQSTWLKKDRNFKPC